MQLHKMKFTLGVLFTLFWLLVACQETAPTPTPPTPTPLPTVGVTPTTPPFPQQVSDIQFLTVAIDAPSRSRDFATIDEFGRVKGFDAEVMDQLATQGNFKVEFIVTSYNGLLESVGRGEFSAAISALVIPEIAPEGIAFTKPYLEIGQVLVVRANEQTVQSYRDLNPAAVVGVQQYSSGEQTTREVLQWPEEQTKRYETVPQLLQALVDQQLDAVVIDHDDAEQYTNNYYQQLRLVGEGEGGWISRKGYGIAVAAGNEILLNHLNSLIDQIQADGTVAQLTYTWLTAQEEIAAGESLIGTLDKEFVLGMVASSINMDPAADPDPLSWELKMNLLSGLYHMTPDNELLPIVANGLPTVSVTGLEYTIQLRPGLTFPDGEPVTATDVQWSIMRSARLGNFLVNSFLKDSNLDGFADDDAVTVVDEQTVKLVLDEPTPYFLTVLATPPYFVVNDSCYAAAADPNSRCGGVGPYTIVDWKDGEAIRLQANPQWPGQAPVFENLQLRFYADSAEMRRSLEIGAIDLGWVGLSLTDLNGLNDSGQFTLWRAPAHFKSYLVFQQKTAPWTLPQVRQAVAYALDKQALADLFQGGRTPLYSPVPDFVLGHTPAEPQRDLEEAKRLLSEVGYTAENPLAITIDYVNDGRYSSFEETYANLIKQQLEETEVFRVTLIGAPYDTFRQKSASCESPAFILGWPPSGYPPYYADPAHWLNFFIFNTDRLCSNYASVTMDGLIAQLNGVSPVDSQARATIYQQIQSLWAQEYPTLELTQETRLAVALPKVTTVRMDALGLLHYGTLNKEGETP